MEVSSLTLTKSLDGNILNGSVNFKLIAIGDIGFVSNWTSREYYDFQNFKILPDHRLSSYFNIVLITLDGDSIKGDLDVGYHIIAETKKRNIRIKTGNSFILKSTFSFFYIASKYNAKSIALNSLRIKHVVVCFHEIIDLSNPNKKDDNYSKIIRIEVE
jgi:hypothetical protein